MTNLQKGIALCLCSTLGIVMQDTLSKHLLQTFSIGQLLFVRYIGFLLVAWWLAMRHEKSATAIFSVFRQTKNGWLQILRSILLVLDIVAIYTGIRYIGIAKAHAIFTLFPIFTTLMAVVILREKITPLIIMALILGFIGALLIIRPNTDVFELHSLFIVAGALCFALYHITTRFTSASDNFSISVAYMAGVGLVVVAPFGIIDWVNPATAEQWFYILLLTVSSVVVHLLIVKSLEYAPAAVLQPYNYTLVAWAALFGWLFYDELLDGLQYVGIVAILLGGLLAMGKIKLPFRSA